MDTVETVWRRLRFTSAQQDVIMSCFIRSGT
jgi:hypothetical protein